MMKVEIKICAVENDHQHTVPYLEEYEWADKTISKLPACCVDNEIDVKDFPESTAELIRIEMTNPESAVSGIYVSQLLQVEDDLFFLAFARDLDEASEGCFYLKAGLQEALNEFLEAHVNFKMPLMQIFKGIQSGSLNKDVLSNKFIPASVFSAAENLEGLECRFELKDLHNEMSEIISRSEVPKALSEKWSRSILKFS